MLTMLRRGAEREEIRVVDDQMGTPTPAAIVADATLAVLRHCRRHASGLYDCAQSLAGTYHTGCAGETSWFGFARAIFAAARETEAGARLKLRNVVPIASEEYPTAARRPRYSVLSKDKIVRTFGVQPPAWEGCLTGVVREWAQAVAREEPAS
jgi:dTDP-4-dehydrorhamnose reductase